MRKITNLLLLTAVLCLLLSGCGQSNPPSEDPSTPPEEEETVQTPLPEETDDTSAPEDPPQSSSDTEETTYEDNFSVDASTVQAFAEEIQSVMADQDLQRLADLAAYPLYVGLPEGGEFLGSQEDFTALGSECIFTDDLLTEIADADLSDLPPSKAGFVLSSTGRPNVVFSVSGGQLAIVGINY